MYGKVTFRVAEEVKYLSLLLWRVFLKVGKETRVFFLLKEKPDMCFHLHYILRKTFYRKLVLKRWIKKGGKKLQKELTRYSEDPTVMKMCKGQNIH